MKDWGSECADDWMWNIPRTKQGGKKTEKRERRRVSGAMPDLWPVGN